MSVGEALAQGRRLLSAISDEADLEAEILLAHALRTDRVHLYQRLPEPLSDEEEGAFKALLERRLNHEPTPYIIGHKEFYGLDFEVTPTAIIPRPETELVVEAALDEARRLLRSRPAVSIVDIGVGCGAIAIALALELSGEDIVAIDISHEALDLARRNAQKHKVDSGTRFLRGDLLEPLAGAIDIIVANLPYVRTADWERLPPEIRCCEPRRGLDGGPDGLRAIERLLRQAPPHLNPGGYIVMEIGDDQAADVRSLAKGTFPRAAIEVKQDLSGLDRVMVVKI